MHIRIPQNKYQSFVDADLDHLVTKLTVDEKVNLLAGSTWWTTSAVPRLGIPVSLPLLTGSGDDELTFLRFSLLR
jgi:hypothetical protein